MKLDTLKDFITLIAMTNPSFRALTDANITAYFEVLHDIPEDVFDAVACKILRSKLYGWPGAGEIYQMCKPTAPTEKQMTYGEALWFKTVNQIKNKQKPHDDWTTAQAVLDFFGFSVADIAEANQFGLDKIQQKFVRIIDSGLIKRRDANGQIITST